MNEKEMTMELHKACYNVILQYFTDGASQKKTNEIISQAQSCVAQLHQGGLKICEIIDRLENFNKPK